MTAGPALPCPKCSRLLEPISWHDAGAGSCHRCHVDFEFRGFPALTAGRTRISARSVLLAEESVCFFHAENRAEIICDDCGRLLCAVCAIDFGGRKRCPACVAVAKESDAAAVVKDRVLYDSLALALAFIPLLVWPVTVVTAPVALGYVIYGWKKPNSLVRGKGRARLVAAGIIASLEIAGLAAIGAYFWLRR